MWKQAQYLQMKDNSVLSLQKYRSQGVRMKKKKIKELGTDCTYFQFVSAPPPNIFLAPAAPDVKYNKKRIPNINITCNRFQW